MNPQLIDALAANLEDEIEVQNRLLEALRRQRLHLLEGETGATEDVTDRIAALLERTDRNRRNRAALLRSAGVDPDAEEPVSEIARRATEESGRRLLGLRRMLVGLAAEVRTLNQFNAGLVRRSAEVVESLIQVLVGQPDLPAYGLAGARETARPRGVLVDREM
jgi:flagellar biosynthesis/type III secretory pathway chaperone